MHAVRPPRAVPDPHRGAVAARRVFASRRGAAASEFALASIPFFIMVLLIMEVAWQLATGAALDHAALRASRFGATGSNGIPEWQRGGTPLAEMPTCRSQGIEWIIGATAGQLIEQGPNLSITTATWGTVGGTGAGTEGAGAGGQITSYTITYFQPWITGGIAARIWGEGGFSHRSTIVIKNEPFTDATC